MLKILIRPQEEFPADLRVEVVLVPRDNPVLLEQARNNLADILNKQYQATLLPSAEDVASSGVDSEERPVGVRADRLAGALSKAWKNVPNNAPPVLSLVRRCNGNVKVFLFYFLRLFLFNSFAGPARSVVCHRVCLHEWSQPSGPGHPAVASARGQRTHCW